MLFFVIATVEGREEYVRKLVSSIKYQFANFEKTIVIGRQFKLQHVEFDGTVTLQFRFYNASRARNLCVQRVKSLATDTSWFFFPDDDCIYSSAPHRALFEDPCVIIAGDVRNIYDLNVMGGRFVSNKQRFLLNKSYFKLSCPRFVISGKLINNCRFPEDVGPGCWRCALEETYMFFNFVTNLREKVYVIHTPDLILLHAPNDLQALEKHYRYGLSQGSFLRYLMARNILDSGKYILVLLRPFVGFILRFKDPLFRNYYIARIRGIIHGIKKPVS